MSRCRDWERARRRRAAFKRPASLPVIGAPDRPALDAAPVAPQHTRPPVADWRLEIGHRIVRTDDGM